MEYKLHIDVLSSYVFHPDRLSYTVAKTYEPDFSKTIDGITYLIEAKGVWWNSEEASKYKHIRSQMPDNYRLVFIFKNPDTKVLWAKKRKDGTKQTHAQWCDKNKFVYFSIDNFDEEEMVRLCKLN